MKDNYECDLTVGSYVTLVYWPGKFDTTLRLYGFLGLNPDVTFVRNKEPGAVIVFAVMIALMVLAILGYMIFSQTYSPMSHPMSPAVIVPIVLGVLAGLGFGLFNWISWWRKRGERAQATMKALAEGKAIEAEESHFSHAFVCFGAVLLGAIFPYAALTMLNGPLDKAEPKRVPAQFHNWPNPDVEPPYSRMKIYYTVGDDEEKRSRVIPGATLTAVGEMSDVVALVKPGRFGWPWIAGFEPGDGGEAAPETAAHVSAPESENATVSGAAAASGE